LGGVKVNEQIVMRPESQTIKDIDGETNEEIRRIRIERFGWPRYLHESGAAIADERHNDRDCQDEKLYRLKDGRHRLVCVDPSTGRKYALGVPREVTSCEQAQNWISHSLDRVVIHAS
jgi:hypothetical protein